MTVSISENLKFKENHAVFASSILITKLRSLHVLRGLSQSIHLYKKYDTSIYILIYIHFLTRTCKLIIFG